MGSLGNFYRKFLKLKAWAISHMITCSGIKYTSSGNTSGDCHGYVRACTPAAADPVAMFFLCLRASQKAPSLNKGPGKVEKMKSTLNLQ